MAKLRRRVSRDLSRLVILVQQDELLMCPQNPFRSVIAKNQFLKQILQLLISITSAEPRPGTVAKELRVIRFNFACSVEGLNGLVQLAHRFEYKA